MSEAEARALNDISSRLGRVEALQETNVRTTGELTANVTRLVDKLDKSDDVAREAAISARSAHKRIDMHGKILFWAGTTIIGAVIAAIIKFNGG